MTLSGQARFICSACGQSVHGHDVHYCPAPTTSWPGPTQVTWHAAADETPILRWLLAEARWHAQRLYLRPQRRCLVCNEPIPDEAALCTRPHSGGSLRTADGTPYRAPNTISTSEEPC